MSDRSVHGFYDFEFCYLRKGERGYRRQFLTRTAASMTFNVDADWPYTQPRAYLDSLLLKHVDDRAANVRTGIACRLQCAFRQFLLNFKKPSVFGQHHHDSGDNDVQDLAPLQVLPRC